MILQFNLKIIYKNQILWKIIIHKDNNNKYKKNNIIEKIIQFNKIKNKNMSNYIN